MIPEDITPEQYEINRSERMKKVGLDGIRYNWIAWEIKLQNLTDIEDVINMGYTLNKLHSIVKEYRAFEAMAHRKLAIDMDDEVQIRTCNHFIVQIQDVANRVKGMKTNSTIGRMVSYE